METEKRRWRNPKGFTSADRLYHIYLSMNVRCYKPNHPTYKNYGKRGIAVCEEWRKDNLSFFHWAMDNGYADDLTLDRIDPDGDYSPENCRWVNWVVQNNNKRENRRLTANGETHTLAEWARITGLMPRTIANRIDLGGWSVEKAITTPLDEKMSTKTKGKKRGRNKP